MIDSNEYLTLLDFVLAPFTAAFIYIIALNFRNKHYPEGHPWRPYFIPGLTVKMIGALLIGLIYAYYYKGGDTYNYHYHAKIINSALDESFEKWINLLFSIPDKTNIDYYEYTSKMYWYQTGSAYTTSAIAAILSAPLGSLYLPTALLFASISFTGLWALFRTFSKLYPEITKQIAIATLFIPSVVLWGSSIFKDTLSLFSLGWLTYSIIQILAFRKLNISNTIILLFSFVIAAKVKTYIIMTLLPPSIFWGLGESVKKIKNYQLRFLTLTISLVAVVSLAFILLVFNSDYLGAYSLDKIAKTSLITRDWILYSSIIIDGSGYDLGDFEPTFSGMISKFPQAVNVTLFRPYIWESKKIFQLIASAEATLLLFITIKTLINLGLFNFFKLILNEPALQFCVIFSIFFAFSVGISTYNFGSLSRYKIPCLPFYSLGIIIAWYKFKPLNKKLLWFL
jgi:hypothetical protein